MYTLNFYSIDEDQTYNFNTSEKLQYWYNVLKKGYRKREITFGYNSNGELNNVRFVTNLFMMSVFFHTFD